jgi:hypothetical protein
MFPYGKTTQQLPVHKAAGQKEHTMKTKHGILFGFTILLAAMFTLTGCGDPPGGGGGGGPITYTAVQVGGVSATTTTTGIQFTFSASVDLTKDNITVSGAAVQSGGSLTGSGAIWTLPVTVSSEGSATVSIAKTGIATGAKTVPVYIAGGSFTPITYTTVQVGGVSAITTTTDIEFTFSASVDSLTKDDIAVNGAAAKSGGSLTGSGTIWTLPVTVSSEGDAIVSITKTGIYSAEQPVAVYQINTVDDIVFRSIEDVGLYDNPALVAELAVIYEKMTDQASAMKTALGVWTPADADETAFKTALLDIENGIIGTLGSPVNNSAKLTMIDDLRNLMTTVTTSVPTATYLVTAYEHFIRGKQLSLSDNPLIPDAAAQAYGTAGGASGLYALKVADSSIETPDLLGDNSNVDIIITSLSGYMKALLISVGCPAAQADLFLQQYEDLTQMAAFGESAAASGYVVNELTLAAPQEQSVKLVKLDIQTSTQNTRPLFFFDAEEEKTRAV